MRKLKRGVELDALMDFQLSTAVPEGFAPYVP